MHILSVGISCIFYCVRVVTECAFIMSLYFFFNDTATTEIYTYDTLFPYTTLFRSPEIGAAGGQFHRSRLRNGPGFGDDGEGNQEVHPLYRRLAAGPAGSATDLHDRGSPVALARAAAQRGGTRPFLRTARNRIFEGGIARPLERTLAGLLTANQDKSHQQR